MRIVVINHVTLDGVMQAPGREDEDTRDGFAHGGWSVPYGDEVMGRAMGERMGQSDGLILGRRTYEELLNYWNTTDSPFKDALNNAQKYVATTSLSPPLPWPNSTLLEGDVADAIGALKAQSGRDLNIMGSGELIRSLLPHDLIDEWMLTIHPLLLGTGRRLFANGAGGPARLSLVDAMPTSTGVVIATYRPVSA